MTLSPPKSRKPLHETVAAKLWTEILSRLQPGARLDSEAALARRYRVSVLTLRQALSVLAHAGMIERRHGSGTYVADHHRSKGVAVGTVSRDGNTSNSFQTRMFLLLSELFRREGYRCRSYVAPFGFLEGWAELAEDIEYGRIAGAAFVAMNAESIGIPFAKKGVPFVFNGGDSMLKLDYADMARRGVRHLVEQGCRKIALMQPAVGRPMIAAYAGFRDAMRKCDLHVREEWVRQSASPEDPNGCARAFQQIWSARDEKPDGLLVTDDVLFNHVAMAIMNAHIRVPEQLRIVSHANKGSGFSYPFPVSFLEVDIDDWAESIVRELISLMNREPGGPPAHTIRVRLISESETVAARASGGMPAVVLT